MKSCRAVSVAAMGTLLVIGAASSCRDVARPEVPPVTTAQTEFQIDVAAVDPELVRWSQKVGGVCFVGTRDPSNVLSLEELRRPLRRMRST